MKTINFYICVMVLLFTIAGYGQFDEGGGGTFPSNYYGPNPTPPGYASPFTFTGTNQLTGVTITTPSGPNWGAINAQADAAAAATAAAIAINLPNQPSIPPPPYYVPTPPPPPPPMDWYLDSDGDGWHSQTTKANTSPGLKWKTTTKGRDCDDNNALKNANCNGVADWYQDDDGDGYHIATTIAIVSPGRGWKEGISKGLDCDDTIWSNDNLNCGAKKMWYLDSDDDGWHSQVKQAETNTDAKWKIATSGVDCNDARYSLTNDCSKADPCAEIKNLLNFNTPGSSDKNVKANIGRLKGVVNTPVNVIEEGFETTKLMNANETYRYEFDKAKPGTEFAISLKTGGSIVGGFHSHPSTGVAIFSFQDLRHLLGLYDEAKGKLKQDIFDGLVAKDAAGNTNVYMLKVDDIEALRKVVNDTWNDKKYAQFTTDDTRRDAIHLAQGIKFNNSKGQIEKSFLEQFPTAGISIYKADATVSTFSKLTLINGVVTPTPCK